MRGAAATSVIIKGRRGSKLSNAKPMPMPPSTHTTHTPHVYTFLASSLSLYIISERRVFVSNSSSSMRLKKQHHLSVCICNNGKKGERRERERGIVLGSTYTTAAATTIRPIWLSQRIRPPSSTCGSCKQLDFASGQKRQRCDDRNGAADLCYCQSHR